MRLLVLFTNVTLPYMPRVHRVSRLTFVLAPALIAQPRLVPVILARLNVLKRSWQKSTGPNETPTKWTSETDRIGVCISKSVQMIWELSVVHRIYNLLKVTGTVKLQQTGKGIK